MGANQRSVQEGLKVKALAHRWTLAFIKGDSSARIPASLTGSSGAFPPGSSQLIDAGATSGGDALSLFKLDTLISKVDDPNYLIMNNSMALEARAGGPEYGCRRLHLVVDLNQFGQRVTSI